MKPGFGTHQGLYGLCLSYSDVSLLGVSEKLLPVARLLLNQVTNDLPFDQRAKPKALISRVDAHP